MDVSKLMDDAERKNSYEHQHQKHQRMTLMTMHGYWLKWQEFEWGPRGGRYADASDDESRDIEDDRKSGDILKADVYFFPRFLNVC